MRSPVLVAGVTRSTMRHISTFCVCLRVCLCLLRVVCARPHYIEDWDRGFLLAEVFADALLYAFSFILSEAYSALLLLRCLGFYIPPIFFQFFKFQRPRLNFSITSIFVVRVCPASVKLRARSTPARSLDQYTSVRVSCI